MLIEKKHKLDLDIDVNVSYSVTAVTAIQSII